MNQIEFKRQYGPWAVITGASDGIGYAFAQQLAEIGLNLVLVARRGDRLNELAAVLMQQHKIETLVLPADLSTPDGLAEVDNTTAKLDVGLLVASAGYGTSGPLLQANLEHERNMLEVNCFAVLHQSVMFSRRFSRSETQRHHLDGIACGLAGYTAGGALCRYESICAITCRSDERRVQKAKH